MTPTKEQLKRIEWAGAGRTCPCCGGAPRFTNHAPDCWLAACLTTPDAPPAVKVGDVVKWMAGREVVFQQLHTVLGAETWNTKLRMKLLAVYRPVWVKETPTTHCPTCGAANDGTANGWQHRALAAEARLSQAK